MNIAWLITIIQVLYSLKHLHCSNQQRRDNIWEYIMFSLISYSLFFFFYQQSNHDKFVITFHFVLHTALFPIVHSLQKCDCYCKNPTIVSEIRLLWIQWTHYHKLIRFIRSVRYVRCVTMNTYLKQANQKAIDVAQYWAKTDIYKYRHPRYY